MMSDSNPAEIATDVTADGSACPNCGRERHEHFCPQCGQNDRVYAWAIGSVTGEFVRETFEVDSRLYRTLKLLLFKPGRLTTEFSRNRRASYMSPVRLYIFASFLFFLVLSLSGTLDSPEITVRASGDEELVERQGPTDEPGVAFVAELPDPIEGHVCCEGGCGAVLDVDHNVPSIEVIGNEAGEPSGPFASPFIPRLGGLSPQ